MTVVAEAHLAVDAALDQVYARANLDVERARRDTLFTRYASTTQTNCTPGNCVVSKKAQRYRGQRELCCCSIGSCVNQIRRTRRRPGHRNHMPSARHRCLVELRNVGPREPGETVRDRPDDLW